MIRLIAVLCSLSNPDNCHNETVVTAGFDTLPMPVCMAADTMSDPAIAAFMEAWLEARPQYKLKRLKCQIGARGERI